MQRQAIAEKLGRVAMNPGQLGEAARAVGHALHFSAQGEEEGSLSPLGLLGALAAGEVVPDMAGAIPISDALRKERGGQLGERETIDNALDRLAKSAVDTGRFEYLEIVEEIRTHARLEEEVFYPAAILVGDYVRMKLGDVSP